MISINDFVNNIDYIDDKILSRGLEDYQRKYITSLDYDEDGNTANATRGHGNTHYS